MFFLLLGAEAFGFLRLLMETSLLGELRPPNRTPSRTMAPDADVIVVVADEPASEVRCGAVGSSHLRLQRPADHRSGRSA
ncbi:MAG: hypothetical protein R2695_21820 [Acidimicrobiales bacterium]